MSASNTSRSIPVPNTMTDAALAHVKRQETIIDKRDIDETRDGLLFIIRTLSSKIDTLQKELIRRPPARPRLLEDSNHHQTLLDASQPLIIGGRDGIPPSDIDITISRGSSSFGERQIAWVPVVLFPTPVPRTGPSAYYTTSRGERIRNIDLGRTTIRESLATAIIRNRAGKLVEVSMTGFATLSLSHRSPNEIADRVASRDHQLKREKTWGDDDNPDESPFIPSEQTNRS